MTQLLLKDVLRWKSIYITHAVKFFILFISFDAKTHNVITK